MKTSNSRPVGMVLAACLAGLLLAGNLPARADEFQEVNRLYRQGNFTGALELANSYLATNPRDAQMRFHKGLILTEQNKIVDAIRMFSSLTEDFPDLPEPHNNLAVLYASQGQYEKARIALEAAIRTHPSYSTAHENLGDIYAKMASQAYNKALQLDKGNAAAQTKLAMIKDLFSNSAKGTKTASTRPVNDSPARTPERTSEIGSEKPQPEKTAGAEPAIAAKPAEKAAAPDSGEIIRTVHAWAKAWSDKNIAAYLAFYAHDFQPAGGTSREAWEKTRRERIGRPKSIQVLVAHPKVSFSDAGHARVNFKQSYRSDTTKNNTTKTLLLVKAGDKWMIRQEQAGS